MSGSSGAGDDPRGPAPFILGKLPSASVPLIPPEGCPSRGVLYVPFMCTLYSKPSSPMPTLYGFETPPSSLPPYIRGSKSTRASNRIFPFISLGLPL